MTLLFAWIHSGIYCMPLLLDRGPTPSYIKSSAMLVPCMPTCHLGVALHALSKNISYSVNQWRGASMLLHTGS